MNTKKWKTATLYLLVALLAASAFVGCNVYEKIDIEQIRCPQIQDTLYFPDWDEPKNE